MGTSLLRPCGVPGSRPSVAMSTHHRLHEMTSEMRPLWSCPNCGRQFANRNQSHTCQPLGSLERHFAGKSPAVRETYDRLIAAVERIGALQRPAREDPDRSPCADELRGADASTEVARWACCVGAPAAQPALPARGRVFAPQRRPCLPAKLAGGGGRRGGGMAARGLRGRRTTASQPASLPATRLFDHVTILCGEDLTGR
jgi:hypothetical protein